MPLAEVSCLVSDLLKQVRQGSYAGQTVDMGGLDIRKPMTAQVTPAPVIRKNEQDVWFLCGTEG